MKSYFDHTTAEVRFSPRSLSVTVDMDLVPPPGIFHRVHISHNYKKVNDVMCALLKLVVCPTSL